MKADVSYVDDKIAEAKVDMSQIEPPQIVSSEAEMTDTTKHYVLDGYLWAYMKTTETVAGYTNIVPTLEDLGSTDVYGGVGYVDGRYVSTSSPYYGSDSETTMTGLVPYNTSVPSNIPTVYVKGLPFNTSSSHCRIGLFNYEKKCGMTYLENNCGNVFTVTELGENYYKFEPVFIDGGESYAWHHHGTMYLAFSLVGSGADLIITLDEPIEASQETEVWKFINTGHAYSPMDYEDRILALESDNVLLKESNTSLKTRVKALENTILVGSDVPDYVLTEAEEVADKILAVRTPDSFVTACASDFHTNGEDQSAVSVQHAGQAMNIINSMTQLDLVSLYGDYETYNFDDEADDGEDATLSFKHVKKSFYAVSKNVPTIWSQGNHDELPADTTEDARQKYYAYIGANNVGTVVDHDNKARIYGYLDNETYKVRTIYLNSTDVSDESITTNCYMTAEQLSWFVNVALNFSNKNNPSEWRFTVSTHHPLNWDSNMTPLRTILSAYKGKTSGSVTVDGVTVSYDFTSATATFVIHKHGHLHNYRIEVFTNGVVSVTVPNACFSRNNEYGTYEGYSDTIKANFGDVDANGNQRKFNKTAGTAEDTAFSVFVINPDKVYVFNYGAGIDRTIDLATGEVTES